MVFWCVFLQCFGEMIRLSLRKQYDGPTEAVVGMFELMAKYGQILLDQQVVITLVVGSIVGGFVTEFFGRRYS
ncbi:tellurite resistance protein [Thalassobium sp. R2A62]|nr:tellurite resistance protein [Thalassobium sp. R2A62]